MEKNYYTTDKILNILRNHSSNICKMYRISRIGLFGSYARGVQKSSSKIDILIDPENITLDSLYHLQKHLCDLLGAEVLIHTADCLKPSVKPYIVSEVIYV